jgi:uncharacterized membrane protein YgdD (TMEM256/DUF423 family)
MPNRYFFPLAGILLALAIALGAFGAHALENVLTPERLKTWETAVHYHSWNSLGVLMLAMLNQSKPGKLDSAVWLIVAGIFIFSGSLYLLCLTDIGWLGAITPIGGVSLIAGWALFAWKMRPSTNQPN